MRNTLLILIISTFQVFATGSYAQTKKINLEMKNASIKEVLFAIEEQSEFYFLFNSELIDVAKKVDIKIEEEKVDAILARLFNKEEVDFLIKDRYIVLTPVDGEKDSFLAQQSAVSGTVTDESGEPLPGVTVVVKGTTQGTVTNADGEYSLTDIPEDATLVFSFVGMQTQEVEVGDQSSINVTMVIDAVGIEEVVAIGYGTLQRNKISTSVTSLKPAKIKDQLTNSIDRTLEGRIAGLDIKQTTGAPGGSSLMRIRGVSSIGGNNDPLVVIDGTPIQNPYSKAFNPLSLIDQSNIASIEVLKDVSATAIYGSRGSNGVILITTKTGKTGETKVSFSAEAGISSMLESEKIDLMNAEEFARWRKENAYERANFYGYEIDINDIPEEYRNPEELGEGFDWQDYMLRVAPRTQYNLNVSHGTENFKGYFSIGYIDEEGIVKETTYQRLNLRANMEYNPIDALKFSLNIHPSFRWWENRVAGGRTAAFGTAGINNPIDSPYKDEGPWEDERYFDGDTDLDIYSAGTFHGMNGLYALQENTDLTNHFDINVQPQIQIIPFKNLVFESKFNFQTAYYSNEYFRPSTLGNFKTPPPLAASGRYNTVRSVSWQFENILRYEKSFGDHEVSGVAGYTMEHYSNYSSNMNGRDYPGDDVITLNAANELTGGTTETNWAMISNILRLVYNYKTKYLFTGTIRRDGSSRFGSDRRWGFFPSASVGWNITKENFFPDTKWLTNMKLRTSYGFSGNNDIGNYTWIPTLSTNNYTFSSNVANGLALSSLENRKLSWEESREFDIGFDLTLFDGKFNLIFDYYSQITENMLWNVTIPISSGFSSMTKNIGKIRNRGYEFAVNTVNISKNNFNWETDFNISFNHNKVINLGDAEKIERGMGWHGGTITAVGEPVGMFYGYQSLGIFNDQNEIDNNPSIPNQLPGTPRYEDVDGNGIIDGRDKTIIGNPHPLFRGGLNNMISYKNWDFSMAMSFAYDFEILANLEEDVLNLDGIFNVLKEVEHRWRSPQEPGNGRIAATFHQTAHDRKVNSDWVYDGSFLKIQNISLGYTFKDPMFMDNLRLYCSVQNPFLITNYRYGNPDSSHSGNDLTPNSDRWNYPLSRTIVMGLNMNF